MGLNGKVILKFGKFAKFYLRFCYDLACDHADKVILDNAYFKENLPTKVIESNRYCISTYGAEIDKSLEINDEIREKFSFIEEKIFSISVGPLLIIIFTSYVRFFQN